MRLAVPIEQNNCPIPTVLLLLSQFGNRLPKAALLDPDAYRRDRLYKEGLAKALTNRIDGFRALFQVR